MQSNKMQKKGFTIIELLIVIFFISVGIIAVLITIQQTMAYAEASSFRLTAIYLAQEGIEIVRNIRDGNWLQEAAWDTNLDPGNWEADYQTQTLTAAYDGDFLLIDGGFYNYSSGTLTSFKRKITIEKQDLDEDAIDDQIKVTITVYWKVRGSHEVSTEEILYNWRQ